MSDREDKKLNLGDELADVKSLIAGAEDGGFSLDDILAEYGVKSPPGRSAIPLRPSPPEADGPDLPWPEAPRPRRNRDNVVAFPGGGALPPEEDGPAPQDESEPEKGPSEPEGEAPEADAVLDAEENGDRWSSFPRRRALWPPSSRTSAKRRMTTPTVCLRSRSRWTQRRSAAWRP